MKVGILAIPVGYFPLSLVVDFVISVEICPYLAARSVAVMVIVHGRCFRCDPCRSMFAFLLFEAALAFLGDPDVDDDGEIGAASSDRLNVESDWGVN